MNRKTTAMLIVLFALLLQVAAPTPPAAAHNSDQGTGTTMVLGPTGTQCMFMSAGQNHGRPAYPTTWSRYVLTGLTHRTAHLDGLGVPCDGGQYYQPYGWIHHRGTVYKNGNFCVAGGWVFNTTYTDQLSTWIADDIWPVCNYGAGVHVWITHDVRHETWLGNNVGYWLNRAQTPFPTTGHCHCP